MEVLANDASASSNIKDLRILGHLEAFLLLWAMNLFDDLVGLCKVAHFGPLVISIHSHLVVELVDLLSMILVRLEIVHHLDSLLSILVGDEVGLLALLKCSSLNHLKF